MWQFMKATGKHYGLRVDSWVDERRDPYKATDAAARHLRDLNDRFGSLYLAAAAYNAGVGPGLPRPAPPARRRRRDSLKSDATFFRLYDTKLLRRETKDYVPKLIAAARHREGAGALRVRGRRRRSRRPTIRSSCPTMTGLDVIARLADTTVAAVREINPQYLRLATPPGGRSVVRIPAGRGPDDASRRTRELPPERRVTFLEHTVARGETLSGIARAVRREQSGSSSRPIRRSSRAEAPAGPEAHRADRRRASPPPWRGGWRSRWSRRRPAPSGYHRVRRGRDALGHRGRVRREPARAARWNALGGDGHDPGRPAAPRRASGRARGATAAARRRRRRPHRCGGGRR